MPRVTPQCLTERRQRTLEITKLLQNARKAGVRRRRCRLEPDHVTETLPGLVEAAERLEDVGEIDTPGRELSAKSDRFLAVAKRFFGLASFEEDQPQITPGLCARWVKPHRITEMLESSAQFTLLLKGAPQVIMGGGKVGPELNGPAQATDRRVDISLCLEH